MRHCAYTLIEVLAVVAIAGLVAAAVTPALVRVATSDPLTRVVHVVREADRLARQQAVGVGGSWSITDDRLVSGVAGWQLMDDRLPTGSTVVLQREDGSALDRVLLDHAGASGDVVIVFTVAQQAQRFRILGLSGAWIPESSEVTP